MTRIEMPIYPVSLYIYKGLNDDEFKKKFQKERKKTVPKDFLDECCGDFEAMVHNNKGHVIMRFMSKKPSSSVVAHEAFHATKRIASHVGLRLCDDSEEAWAYLMADIIERVDKIKN